MPDLVLPPKLVALFVALIVALGIEDPEESVTLPAIVARKSWANNPVQIENNANTRRSVNFNPHAYDSPTGKRNIVDYSISRQPEVQVKNWTQLKASYTCTCLG